MQLEIPIYIKRSFIKQHANTHVFIYSDDRNRNSYMGQAAEACGEPNAFPVTTRFWNCTSRATQSYFRDEIYDECCWVIDRDIQRIRDRLLNDTRRIVLFPNIGKGDAELPVRAPKVLVYLQEQLATLVQEQHNKQDASQ